MRQLQYKKFSLNAHRKNWRVKSPNVCQFELTFKCGLHCRHCYTDCYNNDERVKDEIDTNGAKLILDKAFDLGALWLCLTGGDPLEREDFLEIYSYAKDKGFIVTIFTTGYSMTKKIADYLAKKPPFVIELTINGAAEKTYEEITQIKGSYRKALNGLDLILKRNLPLKVKTMATKQNFTELEDIKKFLQQRKIKFRPSFLLHAKLNGDIGPCGLRLEPEDFADTGAREDKVCFNSKGNAPQNNRFFNCAFGGGDGINIDPYGNIFPCSCIRKPAIDFLNSSLGAVREFMFNGIVSISKQEFKKDSKCGRCKFLDKCLRCPGRALLETGELDAPIDYFCKLAHIGYEKTQHCL